MHRALFALSLLACAPATSPSTQDQPAAPEPSATPSTHPDLLGVMQDHEGLTLQVQSGGCRDKSDVTFDVVAGKLVIKKIEQDTCEALIDLGTKVFYPWAELPEFREFGFEPDSLPVREPGTTPGATKAPSGAVDEWIYGVLVTRDGLDIRVFSGGCTALEDFTTWIEPGDVELVHLVRTRPDQCEADIPQGVELHFTWAQLGVTKSEARLVNPLQKVLLY